MTIISNGTAVNALKLWSVPSQSGEDLELDCGLFPSMHFRKKIYPSPKGTESPNAGGRSALHAHVPKHGG